MAHCFVVLFQSGNCVGVGRTVCRENWRVGVAVALVQLSNYGPKPRGQWTALIPLVSELLSGSRAKLFAVRPAEEEIGGKCLWKSWAADLRMRRATWYPRA